MVTPKEREELAKYLLPRYTAEVNKILKEKGINPEKKRPYDPGHISNVFKGVYENVDIEAAFLEIYEKRKAKVEANTYRKNRLNAEPA